MTDSEAVQLVQRAAQKLAIAKRVYDDALVSYNSKIRSIQSACPHSRKKTVGDQRLCAACAKGVE